MTDSKLIETIRALTVEEREEFVLFIASPYFNRGAYAAELSRLYEFIMAASPGFAPEHLKKEDVHTLIFPQKSYSEGRIDRMMYEINKLAKDFLLTRHYYRPDNERRQLVDWMSILRTKGMVGRVEKELEKLKSDQYWSQQESVEGYYTRYLTAREEHEWKNVFNKVKDDLGLPTVIENLDLFYFSNRLELLNRFLLQQKASTFETPAFMIETLASSSQPSGYEGKSPLVLITLKIHSLLQQERFSKEEFQSLIDLLKQNEDKLDRETLAQLYVYLRNLCSLMINSGYIDFEIILHDIQKDNLPKGYFYNDGKISPYAFLNIVQHALRTGNIQWTYQFMESHKDIITGESETQDFYRMNLALCLFQEKKYAQALGIIPFGSSYSFYHLMARRLELKIYYETQSDVLSSKIDAFKMFISRVGRKNLSADFSELLSNFGNFVSQLSQSIPGDKKRSEQLEKRIREKKLVAERSWLLEKAIELRNGKKR